MSRKYRCLTCQGTYIDVQPDGLRYFHACPDIPDPDFVPDPGKGADQEVPQIPRPDRRDENMKFATKGQPSEIKSYGLGRQDIGEGPVVKGGMGDAQARR